MQADDTRLLERSGALPHENQLLSQKVDSPVPRVFGDSIEKLDPGQLQLLRPPKAPAAPEPASSPPSLPTPAPRPRQSKPPRLIDNLPVVEEVLNPEPVKGQPQDWRLIGQEVGEPLDYEPGRFLKRGLVRRKHVLWTGSRNKFWEARVDAKPNKVKRRSQADRFAVLVALVKLAAEQQPVPEPLP